MPFYALVEAASGDILDVVESLDGPPPAGAIIVELPARDDDVRAWLARWRKDRGGGGGGEVYVERDDERDAGRGGRGRDSVFDAEQFFARLQQEIARAGTGRHQFTVLLFDLAPQDRDDATSFVGEALAAAGMEVLACDLVARVRPHLIAVIMPDADGLDRTPTAPRGVVHVLSWPHDREPIDLLQQRKHPLLRRSFFRGAA